MRRMRTILAAIFALTLAFPGVGCRSEETEYEETPAAEEEVDEIDIDEEEPVVQEPATEDVEQDRDDETY